MFRRSGFEDKCCLENRSGLCANLDRHVVTIIKWGDISRHVAERFRCFDLSRPLIFKLQTLFIRIKGFAIPDVKVVPGHGALLVQARRAIDGKAS